MIVNNKKDESGEKHVFYFKSKSSLDWKAGQDGIFTFKGIKFKGINNTFDSNILNLAQETQEFSFKKSESI